MFKVLISNILFSFLFIPALTLACTCAGYAENLNYAIGHAEHIVLAKVEEFVDHGAKLSVQQEFKGTTGQETILAWGDPGSLCRGHILQEDLGKQIIVLLNKIQEPVGRELEEKDGDFVLSWGTEREKPGDFTLLSCARATYDIVENEEGVLLVKGNLITREGSDELPLDDLQKWIHNPENPIKIATDVKVQALTTNPNISCTLSASAYVKKEDKARAFGTFRPSNSFVHRGTNTRVNKTLQHDEKSLEIEFSDWSWRFRTNIVQTSDEDRNTIEEWVKEHGPIFQLSTHLTYQDGLQHLQSEARLIGGNPTPLYTQTIQTPLDAFKDQILNDPELNYYFVEERNASSDNANIDLPYVVPMIDGYYLEIFSKQVCHLQ